MKLISITILLFFSFTINAQTKKKKPKIIHGIYFSANKTHLLITQKDWQQTSLKDIIATIETEARNNNGLGFVAETKIKNTFKFRLKYLLEFSSARLNYTLKTNEVHRYKYQKIALNLPFNFIYSLSTKKVQPYINLGIAPQFNITNFNKFYSQNPSTIKLKSFNVAPNFGAGFTHKNKSFSTSLELIFSTSLMNEINNNNPNYINSTINSIKNNQLQLNLIISA